MMDALGPAFSNAGAMGAYGARKDDHSAEKAEAIRLGKSAGANGGSQEQIEKKVREVAEEFTAVFMNQIMKSMRSTVQENPAMHGDNGEKFFQEMLDTEQSKSLAKGSGYGLTDLIYQSMMTSYRTARPEAEEQTGDSLSEAPEGADALAVAEVME